MASFSQTSITAVNGRNIVPNEIQPAGFQLVADLLIGASSDFYKTAVALDASFNAVASTPLSFTREAIATGGISITGTGNILGTNILSDIAHLRLDSDQGVQVAIAQLNVPIPAGTTVQVTRVDEITAA